MQLNEQCAIDLLQAVVDSEIDPKMDGDTLVSLDLLIGTVEDHGKSLMIHTCAQDLLKTYTPIDILVAIFVLSADGLFLAESGLSHQHQVVSYYGHLKHLLKMQQDGLDEWLLKDHTSRLVPFPYLLSLKGYQYLAEKTNQPPQ
jgi:hypothetical protein